MSFSLTRFLKGLNIRQENTTSPKEIDITPGGSAGTKTTITTSQTTSRTVTLPDATDTLVGKATTDVLTNKSIDADTNTVTNIKDADIKAGAAIDASKIADGSVSSAEFQFINSLTSNAQTQLTSNATSISNHIANSTGAHAASAISNTPSGNLAATDVQGALNELQTDVDTRATSSALTAHTGASTGVHGVTGAVVGTSDSQTLTNKTLTAPVIATIVSGAGTNTLPTATGTLLSTAAAVTIPQGGTGQTSKAAAYDALSPNTTKGDIEVYSGSTNVRQAVGTDGQVLVADSAQTNGLKWSTISGIKNYILNDGAESSTSGWAAYADAAGSRPVDGTGGSPNVTITRSTSSPLRGVGSFLLTKDAANRQGQGVSYDFTIDSADKAKVLNISFDWAISSGTYSGGTSSTDSDLIVDIYDVTNGVLIEPAPIKLDGGVSGTNYRYVGSFQSASNSTSYRLIVHVATTSASAYVVQFDNVVVGPSTVTTGAYISDWQSYTPVGGWTGSVTYTGLWRRVGSDLEVDAKVLCSGAPTGTTFLLDIPTGLVIDITRLTDGVATEGIGMGIAMDSGQDYPIIVKVFDNNTVYCMAPNAAGTYLTGANVGATIPFTFGASDYVSIRFKVPIVGWGTSQVLSSETDTRIVAASADAPNGQAVSATTETTLNFDNVVFDTHGAITTGASWKYTAPVSGNYEISARVNYGNTTGVNTVYRITLYKNGSSFKQMARYVKPTGTFSPEVATATISVKLNAGDYIHLSANNDEAATTNNSGYLSIKRVSGPSQIAASETVAMRYTDDTAQAISTSGAAIFKFTNKVYDTHSGYNTSTGLYTVPVSGKYRLTGMMLTGNVSTLSTSGQLATYVFKNGSLHQYIQTVNGNGAVTSHASGGSVTLDLKAGDTLAFAASISTAGNSYNSGINGGPHLEIERIGN